MTVKKIALGLMLAAFAGFGATGCNTVEGAGEDISNTGEVISDTAEEAKPETGR